MKRLIYFILGLLVASCYDDKGNYTYQEVNTLDVSLNKVYSVRLDKDTTVTIIPQLSQSLQENEDNLEYTWLHSTTNHNFYGHGKFDTVGLDIPTVAMSSVALPSTMRCAPWMLM